MTKRARVRKRGSVVPIKLVEKAPEQKPGESDRDFAYRREFTDTYAHVEVSVELMPREVGIKWGHMLDHWQATENRRCLELEKAGEVIPTGFTPDGTRELRTIHREVIVTCVRQVTGIDLEDIPSESVQGEELAQLLDDAGLLADVARCARTAQTLNAEQVEL